jgi:hypothetical protein
MALILPVEGGAYEMTAASHPEAFGPDGMTLETMQQLVGGYIEHVTLHPAQCASTIPKPDGGSTLLFTPYEDAADNCQVFAHLVINEEGKLDGLALNVAATELARRGGLLGDVIVGPAILLTDEEFQ